MLLALCRVQIFKTPTRTYLRSFESKQGKQRYIDEVVPDVYRFQRVVDHKMYYDQEAGSNRIGKSQRKVRYYKAIYNRKSMKSLAGDMSNNTDNIRDKSR